MVIPEISAKVDCVWAARAVLGECPVWDAQDRLLYWLDIKSSQLLAFEPSTGAKQSWHLPFQVGSIARPPLDWRLPEDLDGRVFVAGTQKGFAWIAVGVSTVQARVIGDPEALLPGNRFNDGKFGPDGRYYAGTMDDAEEKACGALYALNRDGAVAKLDDGYMVTNGPAFSPCGKLVYHSDSARQVIYRFSLNSDGSLDEKSVFCRFGPKEGFPVGMTVDSKGNLWVAMWDGWRIERIAPDGRRTGVIQCAVPRMTSCTFAEDGVLYATSAATGTVSEAPFAGGLFRSVLEHHE